MGARFAETSDIMMAKRRSGEILIKAGSLCVLVIGMAALNEDLRRHLMNALAGDRASEWAFVAGPTEQLTRQLFATLSDYQLAHGPLVAFGVVGVVLLGFMLRT